MAIKQLTEQDLALVSDLTERAGIAPVLQALAERCAFEASAPKARTGWEDAFGSVMRVAQRVADLEAIP